MRYQFLRYPGGLAKAFTMSYDDGSFEDERLVEIFNRYGIKGTFHLNSGNFHSRHDAGVNMAELYKGHEISCHMVTHPFPNDLPDMANLAEILEDRRALEREAGSVVRGMSYPYGNYNDRVIGLMRTAGIEYSRTTRATNGFGLPENFMEWHPTCHHNGGIDEKLDAFLKEERYDRLKLFYVWGHSYEFPRDDNWAMMEEFCKRAGGRDDVWYATNIEIVDYLNALSALRVSADCDCFYNPSAVDVWFTVNGETLCCPAGATVSTADRDRTVKTESAALW